MADGAALAGRGQQELLAWHLGSARAVDACLDVDAGEFVGVWGKRGAGKTTLLRIAAGLEAPDRGMVRFDGEDLSTLSEGAHARLRREQVGWCAARGRGASCACSTTSRCRCWSSTVGDVRNRRADEALRRVGMAQCAGQRWESLSDGERAFVAIAHGIARAPRLLLVDDPDGQPRRARARGDHAAAARAGRGDESGGADDRAGHAGGDGFSSASSAQRRAADGAARAPEPRPIAAT